MKNSGFTLIETLMVIIMMGILAAIATPSWLVDFGVNRATIIGRFR